MTIAVITGGRDHTPSRAELMDMLSALVEHNVTTVRTGGAKGVDTIVYEWLRVLVRDHSQREACTSFGYQIDNLERWLPNWLRHHNAAGVMRNVAMLTGHAGVGSGILLDQSIIYTAGQPASLCVAFKGGTGTYRCCEAARVRDITTHYVKRRET